jgi:gamma-glutamyltranspeptidase/glutathione hydrolase
LDGSEVKDTGLMSRQYSRREMLGRTSMALALGALGGRYGWGAQKQTGESSRQGVVIGEEEGAKVGEQVLAQGGNAIDAAVAAALTSCVVTPSRCGIGGYGGHMTIATAGSGKITSIDFNTVAPSAARGDMYPLDEKGAVKGRANFFGWQAVGVPGTLAGLQLALDRYGTRSFRELVKPAIGFARDGFVINNLLATTIRGASARFRNDPASAKLYLRNNEPRQAGENLRNPELAALLTTLAQRNSVDSFYRGDIALALADVFKKNNGLVTFKDLTAYQAREVEPLKLSWNDFTVCTAPLTAGGLTMLEAFSILKELKWDGMPASPSSAHARLEALRLAWKDRLELLGDPEQVKVPVERLLSSSYASELASKIEAAVKSRKALPIQIQEHVDEGTNNISAVDSKGNLVAMTLTQGGSFGAQVTAEGLGLTLGHGLSRFTPHADHPNAPGPGKRPLHNMCPSIFLRDGKAVLAIGGAGGVHIPSGLYDVLTSYAVRHASLEEALAAPRLHTTGTLEVGVEPAWPKATQDYLKEIGFATKPFEAARVSAAGFDRESGECKGGMR